MPRVTKLFLLVGLFLYIASSAQTQAMTYPERDPSLQNEITANNEFISESTSISNKKKYMGIAGTLLAVSVITYVVYLLHTSDQVCASNPEAFANFNGPILGGVSDHSIKIWLRSNRTSNVELHYSLSDGGDQQVVYSSTHAASDFTTTMELDQLSADQSYNFQLFVDGVKMHDGEFRTLPKTGIAGEITFAYGADFQTKHQPYSAFEAIKKLNPNFMLLGGDLVYTDGLSATVAAHRCRYRETWSDPAMAAVLKTTASFMMWDDHEIGDDWAWKKKGKYSIARKVFNEYQHSHNPDSTTAGEIYYSFTAGQVNFFVLDIRTHRHPNKQADNHKKTMLGSVQLRALFRWLEQSRGKFRIIVSAVPFNGWSTTRDDSWNGKGAGGFASERQTIFNFIHKNNIPGVVLLSGDQHWSGVFALTESSPYTLYEFMPTPMGASLRSIPEIKQSDDGKVLYMNDSHKGFGFFRINTKHTPAYIAYDWIDQRGVSRFNLTITEDDIGHHGSYSGNFTRLR